MTGYKYPFGVIWLSHSSLADFDKCPRLYYLHNVYKEMPLRKKIQVVNPYLTLGMTVHDTLERIRYLPRGERFAKPLTDIFEEIWAGNGGKRGGFTSAEQEKEFKDRGRTMVRRVQDNPGPIGNLSTVIKDKNEMVASMWLSQADELVLCGNVDWVEVLPDGSLHIIDFKTGKNEEPEDSLQLPIYTLLTTYTQSRKVVGVKYWYLERDDEPLAMPLPDLAESLEKVMRAGKQMKLAKQLEKFDCPQGEQGCMFCRPYEEILKGKGECVRETTREKVYILPEVTSRPNFDEVIL